MLRERKLINSIAVVLLLLLLLVFFLRKGGRGSEGSEDVRLSFSDRGGVGKSLEQGSGRRTLSSREIVENRTHELNDLVDFHHPSIDLTDVSLADGMASLLELYREICIETGETALPIRWEVMGRPRMIPRIHLGGNFLNSCRKLAVYAHMTCAVRDGVLVFSEVKKGPVTVHQRTVSPTFSTHVAQLIREMAGENVSFLPGSENEEAVDLDKLFREAGLLGVGEKVEFIKSSGSLEVTGGRAAVELIDALVEINSEEKPVQIRYELKQTVGGEDVAVSIIIEPGKNGVFESVGAQYLERNGNEEVMASVGSQIQLNAELYGFGERTTVDYSHVDAPEESDMAAFRESSRLDDLNLEEARIDDYQVIKTVNDRLENLPFEIDETGNANGFEFTSQRVDARGVLLEDPLSR